MIIAEKWVTLAPHGFYVERVVRVTVIEHKGEYLVRVLGDDDRVLEFDLPDTRNRLAALCLYHSICDGVHYDELSRLGYKVSY